MAVVQRHDHQTDAAIFALVNFWEKENSRPFIFLGSCHQFRLLDGRHDGLSHVLPCATSPRVRASSPAIPFLWSNPTCPYKIASLSSPEPAAASAKPSLSPWPKPAPISPSTTTSNPKPPMKSPPKLKSSAAA